MIHTLILGFDAFDPRFFESLSARGLVPNLARLVDLGGYSHFEVSNPPQSEVSWTSIATGLNPGGHGLFDFVHRDPASYALYVSLLPTQQKFGLTTFGRPYRGRTIFDFAVEQGYPATSLWWPATFPADPASPVRTLPGLGTPDLLGRLGVGCLYSSDPDLPEQLGKTPVRRLNNEGSGRYSQVITGPARKKRAAQQTLTLPFKLRIDGDRPASLEIGRQGIPLTPGRWSPVLELDFKLNRFVAIRAVTRAILTQTSPTVHLYFLPLQLHPLGPIWPYGTPGGFVKRTWKACGPFLTLGWPQDTIGLEDGCINDGQFLALCESIFAARERVLFYHLENFREGVLASVFDTLDRIQHMYWRDRPDIVEAWYLKLDALAGRVLEKFPLAPQDNRRLVILSDHGFDRFDYKVHLNRWLLENGYLTVPAHPESGDLKDADWSQTKAYAIGLNSLYINLAGREGQGCVPASQRRELCEQIRAQLLAWKTPEGRPVVQNAWLNEEVFSGPLAAYGPDLLVGYSPGFRASAQTGLGSWVSPALEMNRDHWGADHCFDPHSVPGVLFCNQDLANYPRPSYRDIPALTVGAEPDPGRLGPPPSISQEDSEIMEERLKSLGYL